LYDHKERFCFHRQNQDTSTQAGQCSFPVGTLGAACTQQWAGSVGAAHRNSNLRYRDTFWGASSTLSVLAQDQKQQEGHKAGAVMSPAGTNSDGWVRVCVWRYVCVRTFLDSYLLLSLPYLRITVP